MPNFADELVLAHVTRYDELLAPEKRYFSCIYFGCIFGYTEILDEYDNVSDEFGEIEILWNNCKYDLSGNEQWITSIYELMKSRLVAREMDFLLYDIELPEGLTDLEGDEVGENN